MSLWQAPTQALPASSGPPQHLTVLPSRLPAEFDIWYNESFFIPEDMQVSLKPGSSIRPGMLPISRLVSLVSATGAGVGTVGEHRVWGQYPLSSVFSTKMAVYRLLPDSPTAGLGK